MRAARLVLSLAGIAAAAAVMLAVRTSPDRTPENANVTLPTVRLLFVGDNHGVNEVYRRILRDAAAQPYDLLVNLADTSERGTVEEFSAVQELESALPFPVVHVVGNHDILTDGTRTLFESTFNPSYLSRDVGSVHIVLLDNADRAKGFSAQELSWLEQDLAANQKPVTFVFFHRPFGLPFTEVTGDDETPASRKTNVQLLAILRRYPPTHVYVGHLHTYLPYRLDLGDGRSVPATVSGGGGDPAQAALGGPSHNFFHSLSVTVTGTRVEERVIAAP